MTGPQRRAIAAAIAAIAVFVASIGLGRLFCLRGVIRLRGLVPAAAAAAGRCQESE